MAHRRSRRWRSCYRASLDTPSSTALSPSGLLTLPIQARSRPSDRIQHIADKAQQTPVTARDHRTTHDPLRNRRLTVTLTTLASASASSTSSRVRRPHKYAWDGNDHRQHRHNQHWRTRSRTTSHLPYLRWRYHPSGVAKHDDLLIISPAPLTASANSASVLYGASIPALSGALNAFWRRMRARSRYSWSRPHSSAVARWRLSNHRCSDRPAAGNYALAPLSGAALTSAKRPAVPRSHLSDERVSRPSFQPKRAHRQQRRQDADGQRHAPR